MLWSTAEALSQVMAHVNCAEENLSEDGGKTQNKLNSRGGILELEQNIEIIYKNKFVQNTLVFLTR